ncbi:MAG: DUF1552 domain-containing protein [Planctomycetaceae bacterium]|nr:DUF1552 domain-containing protein [Planctomycetaceae bacterium]
MGRSDRIPLARRTLLKGVGAALGLPWLEAMLPRAARAAVAKPPVRMAILYMPNGVLPAAWNVAGQGRDFQLSYILEPLAAVKDDLLVVSNLRNTAGLSGDGHYAKTTSWLTGAKAVRTSSKGIRAGVSVDQFAAQHVGQSTPLASMELGIDPVHNLVDMGYSTVYGCHVSWRTPTLPAAKEIDPQQAFDRLFRSTQFGRSPADESVLDLVRQDAGQLRKALGGSDRQKLDEYLDSVRALEKRIAAASRADDRNWKPAVAADQLQRPPAEYGDYTTHVRLMLDILLMALWTDTTRISSFMFANDVSGRSFSFVDGVSDGFHPLSHHENNADKQEQYKRINRYHVEQYAYLLGRMKQIREGDGTLLDNSMVMFGSSISDGDAHSPFHTPTVLAGQGGGRLVTGRHIRAEKQVPLTNLFVSMLSCLDIHVDKFGDSTGNFDDLVFTESRA